MNKGNEITVELIPIGHRKWSVRFSKAVNYPTYSYRDTEWALVVRNDTLHLLDTDCLGAWLEAKWIAEQNGYTLVAGGPNGQRD